MIYRILSLVLMFLIPLAIDALIIFALIAALRRVGISSRKVILTAFVIFGVLTGCFSFCWGRTDFIAWINPLGEETSVMVYNDYLIPHWKRTLEPVGYEEIPIIELPPVAPPESPGPGKKVGVEVLPIYDFPLKRISDSYIPASILSWGLLGLLLQFAYNGYKWIKR